VKTGALNIKGLEEACDQLFEVLDVGVRFPDGTQQWVSEDWNDTAIICHHAQFDGLIRSHVPAMYLCTMSMARPLHPDQSVALENLARLYELAPKSVPYDAFKGRHWNDLDEQTCQLLASGCLHDVELTYEIFRRLYENFPKKELLIIDMNVRMFTAPKLVGNVQRLRSLQDKERRDEECLLAELQVSATDLRSNDKFQTLLENEGVEIDLKEGKNGLIQAFAKTDEFMQS
jgi:hypothetical protein